MLDTKSYKWLFMMYEVTGESDTLLVALAIVGNLLREE